MWTKNEPGLFATVAQNGSLSGAARSFQWGEFFDGSDSTFGRPETILCSSLTSVVARRSTRWRSAQSCRHYAQTGRPASRGRRRDLPRQWGRTRREAQEALSEIFSSALHAVDTSPTNLISDSLGCTADSKAWRETTNNRDQRISGTKGTYHGYCKASFHRTPSRGRREPSRCGTSPLQAAHHHEHGRHTEAKEHSASAHEHSTSAHKSSSTAHEHSRK